MRHAGLGHLERRDSKNSAHDDKLSSVNMREGASVKSAHVGYFIGLTAYSISRTIPKPRASMGRPESSTRLRVEHCSALPVRLLFQVLPPRDSNLRQTTIDLDGDIDRVRPFRIRLTLTRRGWLFLCSQCERRAAVLYLPPGGVEPGCRACLGLVYTSQYDKLPEWALWLRACSNNMRSKHESDAFFRKLDAL